MKHGTAGVVDFQSVGVSGFGSGLSARHRGWSWVHVAIRRPLDEIQFALMIVMFFFLDPFRDSSGVDLQHVELVLQVVHLGCDCVTSSVVGLELVVKRSHHGRALVSQNALSPLSSRCSTLYNVWREINGFLSPLLVTDFLYVSRVLRKKW